LVQHTKTGEKYTFGLTKQLLHHDIGT
jgi:hypothetical protein